MLLRGSHKYHQEVPCALWAWQVRSKGASSYELSGKRVRYWASLCVNKGWLLVPPARHKVYSHDTWVRWAIQSVCQLGAGCRSRCAVCIMTLNSTGARRIVFMQCVYWVLQLQVMEPKSLSKEMHKSHLWGQGTQSNIITIDFYVTEWELGT